VLEVGVALGEVRPGVDDADDRLALELLHRIADLVHAAAVPERAEIVGREPAR
jgi:hypothetical protein